MLTKPQPKNNVIVGRMLNRLYIHCATTEIRDAVVKEVKIFGDINLLGDYRVDLQVSLVYDPQEVINYVESLAS